MKKIFDYDSSDDEQPKPTYKDSLYLYNAGNAILSHGKAYEQYSALKEKAGYKSDREHSKSITQYLTKKKYTEDIFTKEQDSLLSIVNDLDGKLLKDINEIKTLYQKLEGIQKDNKTAKGKIDTENFLCFKKLYTYHQNYNDQNAQDELCKVFGIDQSKKQNFLNDIKQIVGSVETLDELQLLLEEYPLIEPKVFIDPQNNLSTEKVCIKNQSLNEEIKIIAKVKTLYQKLEDLQKVYKTAKGKIDTENFSCFKELSRYYKTPDNQNAQDELCKVFGIDKSKKQNFLKQVDDIADAQENSQRFLQKIDSSTTIYISKLQNIVTDAIPLDLAFLIDIKNNGLLTFKQLNHNNEISEKLVEVRVFNSDDNGDASTFLSNSLFYQKLLKTTAKTLGLMHFPKQANGEYPLLIGDDKLKINIFSEFTSTLKRTEKVTALGTYENVSLQLTQVREKLEKSDQEIVNFFPRILKGENLFNTCLDLDHTAIKVLYDITYLLFSCEPNRNPSALITNAMFLKLVSSGKYKITDMATKMPMAMSGAIDVGRYYHEQFERLGNKAKKNDYGTTNSSKKDLVKFQELEGNLLVEFLGLKMPPKPSISIEKIKISLKDNINQNTRFKLKTDNIDNTFDGIQFEWSDANQVDNYLTSLTFNQNEKKNFKKALKTLLDKYNTDMQQYPQYVLNTINAELKSPVNIQKIDKLIKDWYGFDDILSSIANLVKDDEIGNDGNSKGYHGDNNSNEDSFRSGNGSDKSDHKSNKNQDFNTSGGTNNKYCSVVLKKLVDYKENASGVLEFEFTELEQSECIEIDNAVKFKLEEILSQKDPSSKKRSFYEAFPEELCYSGFSIKRLKLEDNRAIECYYMKYCLSNTESEIIDRLFWEGVLGMEEWEDYIVLNQPQHETFTERKTQYSDTGYKYKFEITKQKENNIQSLQNKLIELVFDNNNLPFNQQLQNTEVLGNHNGYTSDVEDFYS